MRTTVDHIVFANPMSEICALHNSQSRQLFNMQCIFLLVGVFLLLSLRYCCLLV